ncbi:MAG: exodeoxyribonuclease III [Desulfobacterales bacterium]
MPKKLIKLVSWNVNGLRAIIQKDFFGSIQRMNPDIVAIQETKLQEHQRTDKMLSFEDYNSYWSYSTVKKGYSGVATFTRIAPQNVKEGIGNPGYDEEGRILETDFGDFIFFNVYFPNGQMGDDRLQYKLNFYNDFFAYTDSLKNQGKNLIISGDYNTAHNEIDLTHPKPNEKYSGFLRVERDWMDEIIKRGYVDTFRYFYPEKVKYSWWSYRANARKKNVGWRVDYVFVSRNIIDKGWVKEPFIDNDIFGSDHCPVGLVLEF